MSLDDTKNETLELPPEFFTVSDPNEGIIQIPLKSLFFVHAGAYDPQLTTVVCADVSRKLYRYHSQETVSDFMKRVPRDWLQFEQAVYTMLRDDEIDRLAAKQPLEEGKPTEFYRDVWMSREARGGGGFTIIDLEEAWGKEFAGKQIECYLTFPSPKSMSKLPEGKECYAFSGFYSMDSGPLRYS